MPAFLPPQVKELLQKFDVNKDGFLGGEEVVKMNEALLRKRREVDLQLAAQLSPRARAQVRTIFDAKDVDGEATPLEISRQSWRAPSVRRAGQSGRGKRKLRDPVVRVRGPLKT